MISGVSLHVYLGCLQTPQRELLTSGLLAKKSNLVLSTCLVYLKHHALEGKVLGTVFPNHFLINRQPCSTRLITPFNACAGAQPSDTFRNLLRSPSTRRHQSRPRGL